MSTKPSEEYSITDCGILKATLETCYVITTHDCDVTLHIEATVPKDSDISCALYLDSSLTHKGDEVVGVNVDNKRTSRAIMRFYKYAETLGGVLWDQVLFTGNMQQQSMKFTLAPDTMYSIICKNIGVDDKHCNMKFSWEEKYP